MTNYQHSEREQRSITTAAAQDEHSGNTGDNTGATHTRPYNQREPAAKETNEHYRRDPLHRNP